MQSLQNPTPFFTFPKPLLVKPSKPHISFPKILPFRLSTRKFIVNSYSSDELPIDESFIEHFGPKEKESEEEARRRNWIERGWAPWEEVLTPEADFARKSLNEGEEVALQDPESIESFRMLKPSYRKKKMEEMGLTEDEYYAKQFEIKGEIPEPLETVYGGPMVVRHVPPRDWPPRGWEVDREELEFIRGAHKLLPARIHLETVEKESNTNTDDLSLERYKVFLKQYNEWVAANKDRLEEESYEHDQDYYPGRRKRGKDYKEGMYELPFYYPGQICAGKVTTLHLHQGAFLDIGGVHEGWVPIKGNDWYWIRHHIKVGMHVLVEIVAKRDPYRYRFPIEMRFIDPNIDHLLFNRFDYSPIFHRDEDTNPDELRRDCGRPPIPIKDPEIKVEEESLLSNHPYVDKLWMIHNAEQMVMDDMETRPDVYKDKKLSEYTDDEDFDEENSVEYSTDYYKKALLPKMSVRISAKELDLESAFAERQVHNKLRKEAEARGEKYKVTSMNRCNEMDEYDLLHWHRSLEEREALLRDISCRQALGLPLVEPGKFLGASYFGDEYDPSNPLYRYDYWGEPKNSEKSKQERMTDAHNKSIVGKGTVWYEMSYEEAIKQQMERQAKNKGKEPEIVDYEKEESGEDDDDDDEEDFDFSILDDPEVNSMYAEPLVNGTESSAMSDEGMFED
ncbi:protein PLASTID TRANSCRIPTIONALLY ACTIVE 10 [Impatiens glandulifera]|uniref:protein PLASTID TRANSCRIPTIONALLY ACTIVE 10 n=1 Tax=Impatiens glandulifera TaxID=253017 RepID=UPI001FB1978B|nr:protein PLASTID TRANSCRIPTIONALLY ACTIVE 10 [Impatiens glandulifera]